ncbi:MAG: hypothetical protein K1X72_24655 [Pyrinomonadaceae bacterium]|nr:hypothetical protein [Pyrinomonadaceae bacterium]
MSLKLNDIEINSNAPISTVNPLETQQKAKQVKTMGIIALVLLLTGFIPILGFFGLIASLLLSKRALKMGRDFWVPEQYEKPAYWAWVISSVFLILSIIGLIFMIL